MERELPEISLAFLRSVVDTVPSEIVVRDGQSRILFANNAFASTYNRLPADVIGRRDAELWAEFGRPPEQIASWLAEDRAVMDTEVTQDYIQEIVRDSGEKVYIHNVKTPVTLPDGTRCVLAMYTDVTARRQLDEERQSVQAQAAEIAGIRKAAVTYAHEVNNPLTGILGMIQLLLEGGQNHAESRKMLAEMGAAALRIGEVTSKMLVLGKTKSRTYLGREEMIDLREEE